MAGHRNLLHRGQKPRAKYVRKLVPDYTPSAQFLGWRDLGHLLRYNKIVFLEVEFGRKSVQYNTKRTACTLPYTYACYDNVPGDGLVILVRTELGAVWHLHAFKTIKAYYQRELGCKIRRNGYMISNLCAFSYDEELYVNPGAPPFPVKISEGDQPLNYANLNRALAKRHIQ